MEIRMSKQSAPLQGVDSVLPTVLERLRSQPKAWVEQLQKHPEAFVDLEAEVHRTFRAMADEVVAGVLAEATRPASFAEAAKKK